MKAAEIIEQIYGEVVRWLEIACECGVPQMMIDTIYPNINPI